MKFIGIILLLAVGSFFGIAAISKDVNTSIVGEWKEMSWNYAKSDKQFVADVSTDLKYELATHLVVHKFEKWKIRSNNEMEFTDTIGKQHRCNWYLKGRGNILELVHPDKSKETYIIKSINDHILELHVETAVHARGILKLTLKRIHEKV